MADIFSVLAAAERAVAALVEAAYRIWLAAVSKAVLGGSERFGIAPNPTALWSTTPLWELQVERLVADVEKIARLGWVDAGNQLGIDVPYNPADPILADQLQRTRNLMVRTPDEVYRMIITELGEAAAAGEGPVQQVARVRHVLDVNGVENWPARARTVATTEVHRAFNFGALAAAIKIQQGQGLLSKRWVAREDEATRPAHVRADGQTVPVYQPFLVDSVPMMAPGDPAAPPHLVINCRCKLRYTRSR